MARGTKALEINEGRMLGETEIPTTGSVTRDDLIIETEIQTDLTRIDSKAEELAFMEEPVEIFLHEGTNPNDLDVVPVGVNGTSVYLKRGSNHTIKRKYVAVLATSRPTTYSTAEGLDRDGAKTVMLKAHTSVRYPFAVIQDTPKGMAWLKQIQTGGR